MPNFLIVGAAKSGTTSLAEYLRQHPDCFMPELKEPGLFAYIDENPSYRGVGDMNHFQVTNLTDYKRLFTEAGNCSALGEASTIYMYSPVAAENINKYIPEARLIFVLRNPADRAYSSYMHLVRDGRESISDFESALDREGNRMANNWELLWMYKSAGLYYEQISRYLKIFPREQLLFVKYENFRKNPRVEYDNICRFLGISTDFEPDMGKEYNVSGVPKNRWLYEKLRSENGIRSAIGPIYRRVVPLSVRKSVRGAMLRKAQVDPRVRAELIDYFDSDIAATEKITGLDLSSWRCSSS